MSLKLNQRNIKIVHFGLQNVPVSYFKRKPSSLNEKSVWKTIRISFDNEEYSGGNRLPHHRPTFGALTLFPS